MVPSNIKNAGDRLRAIREMNGLSQSEMAKLVHKGNKSSISRVESGKTSEKTSRKYSAMYCDAVGLDETQADDFLRGNKIVVVDTSAPLITNVQLIEQLGQDYRHVVIPKTVIQELSRIKDRERRTLARKAWEILHHIDGDEQILLRDYQGSRKGLRNDEIIIGVAKDVAKEFKCEVDIITNDIDYSALLKGDPRVKALFIQAYVVSRQQSVNMRFIKDIDMYYADSYESLPKPSVSDVNGYFDNGNTLIISAVRNKQASFEQRKAKVKWLIACGADVNQRDRSRRYFPPLSHAIQKGEFAMFYFLLHECGADPNIASRDPRGTQKVRQKNEGNTPLMVAAWEGKCTFVEELCSDERVSINQQDANGFTALIKACANNFHDCRDVLLEHKADTKIFDLNGKNYLDHERDARRYGPLRSRGAGGKK